MSTIGGMFDFAINLCKIEGQDFLNIFSASSACSCIENGEGKYLLGKSGIEIALECIEEVTGEIPEYDTIARYERSPEYWSGWSLCYYQWKTGRKYSEIFNAIPYEMQIQLYKTLHEADISKVVEVFDNIVSDAYPDTNLKRMRRTIGYSQRKLSEESGVALRTIQMYEQRNKDINKAQAETIYALSKTLGCKMEDLLEKRIKS